MCQLPYDMVVVPNCHMVQRLTLNPTHPPGNSIDGGLYRLMTQRFDLNTMWHGG
jgi:hypothetical protein